jgi:acetyl esterase
MPVVLDPDAAAVYKAFQEAGRPAYETLTAPEARAYYGQARFATNPEPPELARVTALAIPAPHGEIPARIYVPTQPRLQNGLSPRRRLPPARRFRRADRDLGRLPPRARAQVSRRRR